MSRSTRCLLPLATLALLLPVAASAQIAGPDAFGYTAEAAVYDWVDLSTNAGALSVGISTDDAEATVTLPFSFPFYGTSYTQVRVADNGGIYMGNTGSLGWSNTSLPATGGADLLPYWDDLRSDLGGVYSYYDAANGRFVISWEAVAHYYLTTGAASFQVHLYPSGAVEYHYQDPVFGDASYDNGISATVGIQEFLGGGTATNNVQLSYNATTYIGAGTAYGFSSCADADGDSFTVLSCGGTDCDDTDGAIYPGAPETCADGIDQDCDGVDQSGDADGDFYDVCADCDDGDASINPGVNVDGDASNACDDCDDNDPTSYIGATEICDGADNDCDGVTGGAATYTSIPDTNTSTGTGYFRGGKFQVTQATTLTELAVDMTLAAGQSVTFVVYEASSENGTYTSIGSFPVSATTSARSWHTSGSMSVPVTAGNWYVLGATWVGAGTFYYASSSNTAFPYTTPWGSHAGGASTNGAPSGSWSTSASSYSIRVTAGSVDESDSDSDSYLACAGDCNDNEATVYPSAPELCDGFDNNCDGALPATELDGDSDGSIFCDDCNDSNTTVYPGAPELCDGLDNDCDGNGDATDVDSDGFLACNDCDDNDAASYPGATEICDGNDNDCDGTTGTGGGTVADTYEFLSTTSNTPGTNRFRGNSFQANQTVTLTGMEVYLSGSYTTANFAVYESTSSAGPWTLVGSSPYASTTSSNWRASGAMNVTLTAGNYYTIGARWQSSSITYYYGTLLSSSNPIWGDHIGGMLGSAYPGTTGTFTTSGSGYSIRTHTTLGGGDDEVDDDGDGYLACEECDDTDATVLPGGPELCNGLDDNCDNVVPADEFDVDGDGQEECAGDCDETDTTVYAGALELCDGIDNDCNGTVPTNEGDGDSDGALTCADCDDADGTVYPGATEVCDGNDNDCNGVTPQDEVDNDGDSFNECAGLDCNDANSAIYPGATETCDGLDDDCDGVVPANESDDDFDSQLVCEGDCDDANNTIYAGAAEICDALDNDCDGVVPSTETDADGDGVPTCANDCDDNEPLTYPGATEQCDGEDNDCNGAVPGIENDSDGDGWRICDADCDDTDSTVNPSATEICDGEDNDCNGQSDADAAGEVDADADGSLSCEDCDDAQNASFPGNEEICDGLDNDCLAGPDYDAAGETDIDEDGWLSCEECDDDNSDTFPGAAEICDQEDNDCDGVLPTDEADEDDDGMAPCEGDCDDNDGDTYDGAPELCDEIDNDCDGTTEDEAEDVDGDGSTPCDGDCDDTEANTNPTADEICDGEDNDCDEVVPDDELDLDADGVAECDGDCDDEEPSAYPGAFEDTEELCNDGIDNDCDGDRDLREEDCDGLYIESDDDDDGGGRSGAGCDVGDSRAPTGVTWLLLLGLALGVRRRR